jgi:hypothetical protein
MTGEWVGPVNKGLLKSTLVEASDIQFKDLLKYYKTASEGDKIEKLEYIFDGKFLDEDYYSLMLIYEFTDELLKKYGQKILKNNELSKKIFHNALYDVCWIVENIW